MERIKSFLLKQKFSTINYRQTFSPLPLLPRASYGTTISVVTLHSIKILQWHQIQVCSSHISQNQINFSIFAVSVQFCFCNQNKRGFFAAVVVVQAHILVFFKKVFLLEGSVCVSVCVYWCSVVFKHFFVFIYYTTHIAVSIGRSRGKSLRGNIATLN